MADNNIDDVQISRDYIVVEQYKNNADFWQKEFNSLKQDFESAKKGIMSRDKKITKLLREIEDLKFEFKLFEHNWKTSFLYKLFLLLNRSRILRD